MRLAEKVIVVTGAATGIGRASAKLFAYEGARLMIGDINEQDGRRTEAEIAAGGGEARFLPTDVSIEEQVERLVETAVERYGRLDGIFNNAGIGMTGSVPDHSEADFDRIVSINLKSVFFGCKFALPHLLANADGGAILNMSSNGGIIGRPGDPLYNMTKHGIMGLTKSLALAYADKRVRVNALCPGPIDTPIIWRWFDSSMDREQYVKKVVAACPTPRMAAAEEVARAALFLISDEASFITGVGLPVDGGKAAGTFPAYRYSLDFELLS